MPTFTCQIYDIDHMTYWMIPSVRTRPAACALSSVLVRAEQTKEILLGRVAGRAAHTVSASPRRFPMVPRVSSRTRTPFIYGRLAGLIAHFHSDFWPARLKGRPDPLAHLLLWV